MALSLIYELLVVQRTLYPFIQLTGQATRGRLLPMPFHLVCQKCVRHNFF